MNKIFWSTENLHTLGRIFLRNVMNNMRGKEDSIVRFGETGLGIQPNYQVIFPNGVKRTLRGSSHDAYEQTDEFDPEKISQPFNLAAIKKAYEQA